MSYTEEKADLNKTGVTKYDQEKAFEGYNHGTHRIYTMKGEEIKWVIGEFGIILKEGNYISKDETLKKFSKNGDLIWKTDFDIHHDITLTFRNTVLTLINDIHEYNGRNVLFDTVLEIDQDGNLVDKWSTWDNLDHLKNAIEETELDWPSTNQTPTQVNNGSKYNLTEPVYDYYHMNSVQELPPNPLESKDNRFKQGNLLLSLSNRDLIVILNRDLNEIVWIWGVGEIEKQHMPRMLENGNIIIFDNGKDRNWSRIIELNPLTEEIVWEYSANPRTSFFTSSRGSVQRLPNGNTLITESEKGKVFEVTREGEIVWEWYNPEFDEESRRRMTYRMTRYSEEWIEPILRQND